MINETGFKFCGIPVSASPLLDDYPVLQIRHDFEWCTDGFRREMNAWLLEMFGTKSYAFLMNTKTLDVMRMDFSTEEDVTAIAVKTIDLNRFDMILVVSNKALCQFKLNKSIQNLMELYPPQRRSRFHKAYRKDE